MSTLPITLVIPAYNRGHLIEETLQSALAQRPQFESIIVVDDGSTDNTGAVLAAYADRVQLIQTANHGVQAARNLGMAQASTPWIALLDSDDLLMPDHLATVGTWMVAHPDVDAAYCNFKTFDSGGDHVADKLALAPFDFLQGGVVVDGMTTGVPELYGRTMSYQPLFPSGCVIKKSFIDAHGGFDERFRGVGSEDWEFTLRLLGEGRVAICPQVLVRIRKHSGNDSRDVLHVKLGEIKVLEHVLAHHRTAKALGALIRDSIAQRRHDAFNAAFDMQAFDDVLRLGAQMPPRGSLKHRLKLVISGSPRQLRPWLWRAVQKRTSTQRG